MSYNNIKTCEKHKNVHIPDNLFDILFKATCIISSVSVSFTACSGKEEVKNDVAGTIIPPEKVENNMGGNEYNDIEGMIEIDENVTSRGEVERPVNKEENSVVQYNGLLNKMNFELSKKNFSEEANQQFKEIFNQLYKNYPTWQGVYKDLPSVEEYIQNNLIDAIKNINSITIYDSQSEIGKKLIEQGQVLGETDSDGNITMILTGDR